MPSCIIFPLDKVIQSDTSSSATILIDWTISMSSVCQHTLTDPRDDLLTNPCHFKTGANNTVHKFVLKQKKNLFDWWFSGWNVLSALLFHHARKCSKPLLFNLNSVGVTTYGYGSFNLQFQNHGHCHSSLGQTRECYVIKGVVIYIFPTKFYCAWWICYVLFLCSQCHQGMIKFLSLQLSN